MTTDFPPVPWTPAGPELDEMWAGDGTSDPITDHVPDMLATLFTMQSDTMSRLYERERMNGGQAVPVQMNGMLQQRMVQGRLHEIYGFVSRELGEAMAHLDAKPWKKQPRPVVREEFVEEVTDSLLFFIEFCIVAGITAEELFQTYVRKTTVVVTRAGNGTH